MEGLLNDQKSHDCEIYYFLNQLSFYKNTNINEEMFTFLKAYEYILKKIISKKHNLIDAYLNNFQNYNTLVNTYVEAFWKKKASVHDLLSNEHIHYINHFYSEIIKGELYDGSITTQEISIDFNKVIETCINERLKTILTDFKNQYIYMYIST